MGKGSTMTEDNMVSVAIPKELMLQLLKDVGVGEISEKISLIVQQYYNISKGN